MDSYTYRAGNDEIYTVQPGDMVQQLIESIPPFMGKVIAISQDNIYGVLFSVTYIRPTSRGKIKDVYHGLVAPVSVKRIPGGKLS